MAFSRNFYDFQVVTFLGDNPDAYFSGVNLTAGVEFLPILFSTSTDINVYYRILFTTTAPSGTITIKGKTFNDEDVTEVITITGSSPYESLTYFLYVTSIVASVDLTNASIGRGGAASVPYLANFRLSNHFITVNSSGNWTLYGRITNKDFAVPYSQEYPLSASFDNQTISTTYPLQYDQPIGMMRMVCSIGQGSTIVWSMGTQQIK